MSVTGIARGTCHLCGAIPCQNDCKKCPVRLTGECRSGRIATEVDGIFRYLCYECAWKEMR
jgi:hypothetical protein